MVVFEFASDFRKGKALASNLLHCSLEPFAIISLASVKSKSLFVKVAEKVKRFDADICPA